jgi:putative ABC transport system permease protein
MEIRPIFNALLRNRTSALLIAIQVALTLAIVVNATFIINQKLGRMDRPVGLDIDNTFTLRTTSINTLNDHEGFIRSDMETIRSMPGVLDSTPILTTPQGGSTRVDGYHTEQGGSDLSQIVNINYMDEHGMDALGLAMVEGRNFTRDEIRYVSRNDPAIPDKMIITVDYAKKLFPEGNALGNTIYYGENDLPIKVIGIAENMAAGWFGSDNPAINNRMYDMAFHPYMSYGNSVWYLVRTEPGAQNQVMLSIEDALTQDYPERLVDNLRSQVELLERVYSRDKALAIILVSVITLLVIITSLGVVGMASSSVSQRRKQIGTRRALGAQKADIIRYFLVENFLITSLGVLAGCLLAYGFNFWLVSEYAQTKLEDHYVPIGVAALYLIGQLAVLLPAFKASNISPATATRSI